MRTRHFPLASLAVAAAVAASSAHAAESARLATYAADGQTSYALSVAPQPAAPVPAVDVVVIFDTSASQQGAYRDTALAALDAMLAGMRPTDRVHIMAVDVDAVPLMDGFAAASDPATVAAVLALRDRAPLGSTNLEGGLTAAVKQLEQASSTCRAITYVGDGASKANMLDAATLQPLVDRLRVARTAVSSYAIGPEVDAQTLAALANQTGGNLYAAPRLAVADDAAGVTDERAHEENLRQGQAVGKDLANWTRVAVLWPTAVQLPDQLGQFYPESFPPLRSDRDTVVLGRTTAELLGPQTIRVTAAAADGTATDLNWNATPDAPNLDQAYLAELVNFASRDGGVTLPTVGSAGLAEAARLVGARVDELTMLAERAVASGDRAAAGRIVQAVLQRDPGNVQARTVQAVVESDADPFGSGAEPIEAGAATAPATPAPATPAPADTTGAGAAPLQGDIVLQGAPIETPVPAAGAARIGANGAFLDEVEQERRVFIGMLEKEIQNTVIRARERMATEPTLVAQDLKLALENLMKTPDVDEAKRAELADKLDIALREAQRQASIKDELDRLREAELAAAREQKFLNERLTRRLVREKQLMDRFNALMDERKYVEAEEVAAIVAEIDPIGVTPVAATLWARHTRHKYLVDVTRSARWAAAWDTMFQIELSHIPFPDNPPIVYPDAPVWEELSKRRKARYASVDLKTQGEAESRIFEALRKPLISPLQFPQTPLNTIMGLISDEYDIPIVFDTAALDAVAVSPDQEIDVDIGGVTLRSALDLMLKQVEDLTYVVDNEVLLITTEDEANTKLQVKVYPVADLVLPIENLGIQGLGGGGGIGGGGLGGGGGGGGLGGGGGGFGGGGGGFGGGGQGGGGGGGFFAIPDRIEADSVGAVAVTTPVAPVVPATPVAAPADESAAEDAAAVEAIDPSTARPPRVPGIEIDLSKTPDEFWSQHFAAATEDAEVVRRGVAALVKQKQYDHAIAMINAALSHGQPQSWMYESLGIAKELGGRPKADVERAIMSACDFSTSPEELMLIARYLGHMGLDKRALDVYRQVIKVAPLHQEAYALGLQAAQRAEDVDGIRWSTVGILRQAWPANQEAVRNAALRTAKATLDELAKKGDQETLAAFQADLNAALIRDCVVKVTWTGDADVDLMVDEPAGTTCSLREPRTASGGVMLGDSYAGTEETPSEGFSETYVCPEGYAGEYRVRIRKVWGELVAGRVTVDVYKNFRSQDEEHERQHIAVGTDDAAVVFNLNQGRRAQPLADAQLAAAVDRQAAVSRAVLAQQLGSLDDLASLPIRGDDPVDLRRALALARGGQVGFQPVIITLPEGTQLFATAVVSADRRYVRITASPSFTGIGNVTTFTFAGAGEPVDQDQDQDQGDGGGDGGGGDGGGNGGGAN